jgi:anthranilate phosphoribosyltransferase
MSIASYIKEIGRGKEGARSLTQAQAYDLMSQVLDGHVSDLEVGAFCIAMRIKGETTLELAGFLEATQERCVPITAALHPNGPVLLLPSYNGARKLPNLTALLALLLAQKGASVLVHGVAKDAGRVTTADVFHDLGLPIAHNASDMGHAWSRREPVFMAIDTLCPALAKLLEVRRVIGLRNPGHTVAKLLDPTRGGAAMRVVNHTHPEYAEALSGFLQHTQANAMLMRGTEGEPAADPRRLPRLDIFLRGTPQSALSRAAKEGVLTDLPVLPRSIDAATTAVYIQSVVSGEAPAPLPITQQVDCLIQSLKAMST